MDILIRLVQFFMSLSLLVAIHEFGHFIMARIFRIRVEKFYIFFNPWFSIFKFKRGDTEYGLGWVPLGGYVKIAGMIDESMDTEQMKQPAKPDEFRSKPAWQRFLVMIAGVVMNLLLAFAIYCGISYKWGKTYVPNDNVKWGYNFNEAAHGMGFEDGDKIVSIDGKNIDNYREIFSELVISDSDKSVVVERKGAEVSFTIPYDKLLEVRNSEQFEDLYTPRYLVVNEVTSQTARDAGVCKGDIITDVDRQNFVTDDEKLMYIQSKAGNTITLNIERGSDTLTLNNVPVSNDGLIGIERGAIELRTQKFGFWASIPAGARLTRDVMGSYWQQLKMIFKPKTQMYKSLGGFISIGKIFPSEWDWLQFWSMTAFLSIILAIMNILPIPGLDGGHALFTFWEMITGRKVSDKVLEIAQYIGLAIILLLLVYANGNDIYKVFIK
ncbi:MAG: RIP metalloprotease RseP [Alistipes sp.]|nr:RIP metalloprotease RseP [Alistipes sp.]